MELTRTIFLLVMFISGTATENGTVVNDTVSGPAALPQTGKVVSLEEDSFDQDVATKPHFVMFMKPE